MIYSQSSIRLENPGPGIEGWHIVAERKKRWQEWEMMSTFKIKDSIKKKKVYRFSLRSNCLLVNKINNEQYKTSKWFLIIQNALS